MDIVFFNSSLILRYLGVSKKTLKIMRKALSIHDQMELVSGL